MNMDGTKENDFWFRCRAFDSKAQNTNSEYKLSPTNYEALADWERDVGCACARFSNLTHPSVPNPHVSSGLYVLDCILRSYRFW